MRSRCHCAPTRPARRMLSTLAALAFDFARERPLVFVIDDLQWADELSWDLLSLITAQDCARSPLVLLGTVESTKCRAGSNGSSRIRAPSTYRSIRMDKAELGQMVGGMLALHNPPVELVEFLHAESNGNPFLWRNTSARRLPRAASSAIRMGAGCSSTPHWKTSPSDCDLRAHPPPSRWPGSASRRISECGGGARTQLRHRAFGPHGGRGADRTFSTPTERFANDRFWKMTKPGSCVSSTISCATRPIPPSPRTIGQARHARGGRDRSVAIPAPNAIRTWRALGFHLAKAGSPGRAAAYFEQAANLAGVARLVMPLSCIDWRLRKSMPPP